LAFLGDRAGDTAPSDDSMRGACGARGASCACSTIDNAAAIEAETNPPGANDERPERVTWGW
jgi:hypothetical protein